MTVKMRVKGKVQEDMRCYDVIQEITFKQAAEKA
jgi:hypothetical protein